MRYGIAFALAIASTMFALTAGAFLAAAMTEIGRPLPTLALIAVGCLTIAWARVIRR